MIRKLILPSIVLGGIISLILMEQVGNNNVYVQSGCGHYNPAYANVRRVDCTDSQYGYPLQFVRSETMVDISSMSPSNASSVLVGSSSISKFNAWNFIADLAIWSAASFVVLAAAAAAYQPGKKRHETKNT